MFAFGWPITVLFQVCSNTVFIEELPTHSGLNNLGMIQKMYWILEEISLA